MEIKLWCVKWDTSKCCYIFTKKAGLRLGRLNLYIIDGVLYVRYKILRIGPKDFLGPVGPRCQPKARTLAEAGGRPTYMLVHLKVTSRT